MQHQTEPTMQKRIARAHRACASTLGAHRIDARTLPPRHAPKCNILGASNMAGDEDERHQLRFRYAGAMPRHHQRHRRLLLRKPGLPAPPQRPKKTKPRCHANCAPLPLRPHTARWFRPRREWPRPGACGWLLSQSRAARWAQPISASAICSAISRRNRAASRWPRMAAMLNHLCACDQIDRDARAGRIDHAESEAVFGIAAGIAGIFVLPSHFNVRHNGLPYLSPPFPSPGSAFASLLPGRTCPPRAGDLREKI